mmetsp:Transcript_24436/g.51205  ORF Transcript_24436/g.51205 Transcript_24436/m.51205 type:complete len:83 (-) Transcript_24436:305-553(-)
MPRYVIETSIVHTGIEAVRFRYPDIRVELNNLVGSITDIATSEGWCFGYVVVAHAVSNPEGSSRDEGVSGGVSPALEVIVES